jgi:hypothetical protein
MWSRHKMPHADSRLNIIITNRPWVTKRKKFRDIPSVQVRSKEAADAGPFSPS